jgi:hypothetical protein
MTNGFKHRVIELLEEDIAQADKAAHAWTELDKHRALLEDLNGNVIGSARDQAERYREHAKELRALLASMGAESGK